MLNRTTIQETAADLAEEIKTRSASGAAAKLAHFGGVEIAAALLRLSPGFAQDVLAALPDDARERTLGAAPPAVARQWQRNALYDEDAVGRMMEPVVGAFPPDAAVGEAVDALREAVKAGSVLITYIWVVDEEDRLVGIVTMRDLLFNERARALG
jgi:magnesium transporter